VIAAFSAAAELDDLASVCKGRRRWHQFGSSLHAAMAISGAMMLLVPSNPLNGRKPDEYFAAEAAGAEALGWAVGLLDHDALCSGESSRSVRRVEGPHDDCVYRGWMVRSEQYATLFGALTDKGVQLRTPPEAYRAAHELPGWYSFFEAHTATSVWLDHDGTDGLVDAVEALPPGPGVVKDWVKSMKHYWAEAAFVPDVTDTSALLRVARRFLELREDDLVGGVVVRSFEAYERGEARSWWVGGNCALVSAHPDTPDAVPQDVDPSYLGDAVAALGSPFATVDLARTPAGPWRVVEVGDGQVSDRPASLAPELLLSVLGQR